MILTHKTVPTIVSEGMESTRVSISAKKASGLQRIVRDYIYTNKKLAPIREVTCNAIDEHRKYKVERPVEIGIRLVDGGQHEFFVRDYANGLSDYDIKNVMFSYLESTKDKANDENGGFGVGSLSPNAYTDTFYTNSHFKGIQTSYIITLNSDDNGMSVGDIITVGSQPTEESGIEVIVPIKRGDYYEFEQIIRNFVRFCPSNIVAKIPNADDVFPDKFSTEIIKGDYKFRIYDNATRGTSVYYQQGDVIYKTDKMDNLNKEKVLVVNIPIGRLSLPISREAFEETRANQRILEEIKGYIQELENQDMETFAKYTTDDLIKDKENTHFIGQIFTCKKTKVFPGTAQIISSLRKTFYGENAPDFEKFENKIVIGIIPNNKAKDMWMDRLMAFSKEQNKQYWSIVDSSDIEHQVLPEMIVQNFVFKKVKSKFFPMKKAETAGKKDSWVVCEQRNGRYRYNIHKHEYTALELHNEARKLLKLEEAEDLEEAALQMQDMVYNTTTELHMFTINNRNDYGSSCPYWWTASQKLRDQLKVIGWFELHTQDYKDIVNRLYDIERKKQAERQLVANCYPSYIVCQLAEKRKAALPNRIRRAEKISELIHNIKNENSLRGRVLQSFGSNYYAPKMTRHEFRQIMKLSLTNDPIGV